MINQFTAIGRLTKDIELRSTADGKSVADINIAIQNKKDDVTFLKVTAFNHSADFTAKYCKKGDLIGVSGIIKNHNWTDKDGNKRYDYTFLANRITFLSAKKQTEEKSSEEPEIEIPNAKTEYQGIEISDSELPF